MCCRSKKKATKDRLSQYLPESQNILRTFVSADTTRFLFHGTERCAVYTNCFMVEGASLLRCHNKFIHCSSIFFLPENSSGGL